MKVLFAGQMKAPSRCWQRMRAFEDLGHTMCIVDNGDGSPRNRFISVIDRILWKMKIPRDAAGANAAIILTASECKPDLIWIEKGNTISRSTLQQLKALCPGKPLVSYSEDDMFAQHNRSIRYRRGLAIYDVVFTTKSYNCRKNELPALGARRVVFVDKGYDKWLHRPVMVPEEDRLQIGSDVGFIGTYEDARAKSILFLAQNGVRVKVRGFGGWDVLTNKHQNLDVLNEAVMGEDYIKVLCSTKINLCFLRKANRDLQTDRSIEIPACGAFMLAERTKEHLRLFREGHEAAFFSSKYELLEKIRYYLKRDNEREMIAKSGRQRCETSGYSHQDRIAYMLAMLYDWTDNIAFSESNWKHAALNKPGGKTPSNYTGMKR